jgi:hypothetical protein
MKKSTCKHFSIVNQGNIFRTIDGLQGYYPRVVSLVPETVPPPSVDEQLMRGSIIALPLGNTPSTHIVKPEPERFSGLVANEVLCMTLAKALGLNVPLAETRSIGGKPCIVVQRYDRTVSPKGTITRVHQEDFCQALGFPPERKYQQEGGPLLRDCIAMLREWASAPVLDIRDFLDGLIFNVLLGNADAHLVSCVVNNDNILL